MCRWYTNNIEILRLICFDPFAQESRYLVSTFALSNSTFKFSTSLRPGWLGACMAVCMRHAELPTTNRIDTRPSGSANGHCTQQASTDGQQPRRRAYRPLAHTHTPQFQPVGLFSIRWSGRVNFATLKRNGDTDGHTNTKATVNLSTSGTMANLLTTAEKVRVAREIDSANACREVGQRILRGQKVGFGLWRRASRDTVQLFGVPPGRHKRGFASGVPGAHVMAKVHQPANKQRIRFANYDDCAVTN
jgi:hypothetical protein